MACSHFLDFQPTERPAWRGIKDKQENIPNVSQMIKDILGYEKTWTTIKNENTKQRSAAVEQEMYAEFLYHIQNGEGDMSVHDGDKFKKIVSIVIDKASSQDSLQSVLDAEDETMRAMTTETINLLLGYLHLENFRIHERSIYSNYLGLVNVTAYINECHKILMKGVMIGNNTVPGTFSVLKRSTTFNGTEYHYPIYQTEEIAHEAVQCIVDQCNNMIEDIYNDNKEMIEEIHLEEQKETIRKKSLNVHVFSYLIS